MAERRKHFPVDFGDVPWRMLLGFALQTADRFECAIPYPYVALSLERAPLWPRGLNAFRGQLIDRHVNHVRWDRLQPYPTQYVRFRLTPELRRYVQGIGPLDNWLWANDVPEDPAFYVGEEPLLMADSIDGRIAVFVRSDELDRLAAQGVRLVQPLGVAAEPWPTP